MRPPELGQGVDRELDPLPSGHPHREQEQRVGLEELEPFGDAHAGGREAEDRDPIDPVRHDSDLRAGEAGERAQLVRGLLGDRDVAHAVRRRREERPGSALVPLGQVLRVGPGEVVGPGDEDARPLRGEADERLRQGGVEVEGEDVVHDDPIRAPHVRTQLA